MKQATLTIILLTILSICFARLTPTTQDSVYASKTVLFNIPDAGEMLSEIMKVTGLAPNFELKEANVQNVEAAICHRKRYILYNPEYISWLNNATNSKWAAITILAHEIGHHVNGHTIRKGGSRPLLELEADEFAGFVLFKLGDSLEQSQDVMKYIAKTNASKTHPARYSRMLAIENGWNKAASSENAISKATYKISAGRLAAAD
ncbi:MAG: hypothetical protein ABI675_02275 [Chitinophagaceae bacterium]